MAEGLAVGVAGSAVEVGVGADVGVAVADAEIVGVSFATDVAVAGVLVGGASSGLQAGNKSMEISTIR